MSPSNVVVAEERGILLDYREPAKHTPGEALAQVTGKRA
jgi:hypothetical protein